MTLPTNIDATYADGTDGSIALHQQHHDTIHGIVNNLPAGGTFALPGSSIADTSVGTVNDWTPTGIAAATIILWNGASAVTITSLTGGSDGRVILIMNTSGTTANTLTLQHDIGSGGTAANRFLTPSAANTVLQRYSGVAIVYDSTATRWRVLMPFTLTNTTPSAVGTAAVGSSGEVARANHVHPTGAGTPSTQAFGDSATTGSGPAAAMDNHKHAMPADPVTAHEAAGDPHTGYRLESANHTHQSSGLQGGQVTEAALSTSDVTTADLTTAKHGFAPKAPNDTGKWLRGDATWAVLPGSSLNVITSRKNGDQTMASTTLTNVTGMSFPIGASETWTMEIRSVMDIPAPCDGKMHFTVPSGATGHSWALTGGGNTQIVTITADLIVAGFGIGMFNWYATIVNSTNAGTVQFQMAQFTGTGDTIRFYGDSVMLATQLS